MKMANHRRAIDQLVEAGVDLYKELELTSAATQDDIKRSYRKLALRYHPDRVPASEKAQAEVRFKRVNQAHEILSDPQLRQYYDRLSSSRGWKRWFTPGTAGTGNAERRAEAAGPGSAEAAGAGAFAGYTSEQAMDHFSEVFQTALEQYRQLYETAMASNGDGDAPALAPFWTALGAVAGALVGAWLGESKQDKVALAATGAALGGGAGYILVDKEGAVLRRWWNGLTEELKRKLLNELSGTITASGEAFSALRHVHTVAVGAGVPGA